MVEAYMTIGHHTLVTMARSEICESWRVTTYRITPQCNGLDVAKLLQDKCWTQFVNEAYAPSHSAAVALFGRVVASEIQSEHESIASLESQERKAA